MSYLIKGNVYQIICLPNPDIRYIGSTFDTLRNRWQKHKSHFQGWLEGKKGKCSIYKYFKEYGIDNFKILPLKSYLVCADNKRDHKHLSVYEQLYINKLKCVNKNSAFAIEWLQKEQYVEYRAEYRANKKEHMIEYQSEYYSKNKGKFAKNQAEYYSKNKEKIAERRVEYVAKNKEQYDEYQAEYRAKNKEQYAEYQAEYRAKNKEKIVCECGSVVTRNSLSSHKKSQKHQNLIKSN